MKQENPSAYDNKILKAESRRLLQGHFTPLIRAFLLMEGILLISENIISSVSGGASGLRGTVIDIIILLLYSVLEAGMYRIYLRFARSQDTAVTDLFYYFRSGPDQVILTAAVMLAVKFAAIAPYIFYRRGNYDTTLIQMLKSPLFWGALLLSLLLFSLVQCLLLPVWYLSADYPQLTLKERYFRCFLLMSGNIPRTFLLFLSFAGYFLLSLFSFGIGFLWVIPYIGVCTALYYISLKETISFEEESIEQDDHPL